MEQIAAMRVFIYTDDNGVIHISDPADWRTLPVSHTIGDAGVAGDIDLDDVQVTVRRRQRFSRVRVTGTPVVGDVAWGPGMKPNRLYAGATNKITITAGDDPVELWLEPRDGMFWVGEPDLAFRYAGEAVTEPWHKEDDFARGRGTWVGGHIRDEDDGTILRWATPSDVLFTVEQVTASKIKVTITPGPTLAAGLEYVNLPSPNSPGLPEQNPDKLTQFLPVIRGPGRGYYGTVEGVSSQITPDPEGWGDLDEYVHEAGLNVQSVTQAEELAQIFADSHTDDFGQVTIHCALDTSVKVGQRVHVKPTSRSDATLDGVVTGIPSREVPAGGAPSMTLTLWVLAVQVHSITYDERAALVAAQHAQDGIGATYDADLARNTALTYDQEQGRALMTGHTTAPPVTDPTAWQTSNGAGDTATAVTEDGRPALKVTEDGTGTSLYVAPARYPAVADGDLIYATVEVKVTHPGSIRIWTTGVGGASVTDGNSTFIAQAPADGWVRHVLPAATVTGTGTIRAAIQAAGGNYSPGQGFFIRDYLVRTYR